jgi:vitamin B12 transporter
MVVGAEGEKAEATNHDSFGLDLNTHHRSSNAVFVEDRFSRGPFELSAGARYDHYDTFGGETSPRVGVAWSHEGHKVHAAYGQAFRAPQIGELYLPFFGNPDLHAEHSHSVELGYDRFFSSGAAVSVTAFRNTFRDLITYDLAASRFANIGLARSSGVELAASDRRGPFTGSLSYTFLRATEEPSGAELARRPKHSGSVALGYIRGAASAELVVARVGSRADVNDLVPFDNVTNRAYTVADITFRWSVRAFEPYAKIENLTNTHYQEVFGYPSPTRRGLLGVRYIISR